MIPRVRTSSTVKAYLARLDAIVKDTFSDVGQLQSLLVLAREHTPAYITSLGGNLRAAIASKTKNAWDTMKLALLDMLAERDLVRVTADLARSWG